MNSLNLVASNVYTQVQQRPYINDAQLVGSIQLVSSWEPLSFWLWSAPSAPLVSSVSIFSSQVCFNPHKRWFNQQWSPAFKSSYVTLKFGAHYIIILSSLSVGLISSLFTFILFNVTFKHSVLFVAFPHLRKFFWRFKLMFSPLGGHIINTPHK